MYMVRNRRSSLAKAKILNMPKKVEELIRRTREELLLEEQILIREIWWKGC